MADFLDDFMAYTDGIPSPGIYRLWSGIAALAGAMERRFWTVTASGQTFPNLYVCLTADPSTGKSQAISRTKDLWMATKKMFVAPTSMTSASMLDVLIESKKIIYANGGIAHEYHSIAVPAGEFAVFVNAFDREYLGRLCDIWDCIPDLRVRRKYIKDEVSIVNPQITLLAGVQPGFLHSILPEEAWRMGFPARLMMVYAEGSPKVDLWTARPELPGMRQKLTDSLFHIIEDLRGQFQWSPKAQIALSAWHRAGLPPVPNHERLTNYNGKRIVTIIKLAMISSIARGDSLVVSLDDFDRAKGWMLDAESCMHEIFKNMINMSDSALITEIHHFILREWVAHHRPIHQARIYDFMRYRIRSVDRADKIVEMMVAAGMIERARGHAELFIPRTTQGAEHAQAANVERLDSSGPNSERHGMPPAGQSK